MVCPHSPALNPSHQMTSGTQKTSRGNEKMHPPRSEAPDAASPRSWQERTVVPAGLHRFLPISGEIRKKRRGLWSFCTFDLLRVHLGAIVIHLLLLWISHISVGTCARTCVRRYYVRARVPTDICTFSKMLCIVAALPHVAKNSIVFFIILNNEFSTSAGVK